MSDTDANDELEEGCLYVFKKGQLQEIESDPDDLMKKIKITPDSFAKASALQSRMRKFMQGYRPDISTICSALIDHAAEQQEADMVVRDFAMRLYQSFSDGGPS